MNIRKNKELDITTLSDLNTASIDQMELMLNRHFGATELEELCC